MEVLETVEILEAPWMMNRGVNGAYGDSTEPP
jgi:hypothetical protein